MSRNEEKTNHRFQRVLALMASVLFALVSVGVLFGCESRKEAIEEQAEEMPDPAMADDESGTVTNEAAEIAAEAGDDDNDEQEARENAQERSEMDAAGDDENSMDDDASGDDMR